MAIDTVDGGPFPIAGHHEPDGPDGPLLVWEIVWRSPGESTLIIPGMGAGGPMPSAGSSPFPDFLPSELSFITIPDSPAGLAEPLPAAKPAASTEPPSPPLTPAGTKPSGALTEPTPAPYEPLPVLLPSITPVSPATTRNLAGAAADPLDSGTEPTGTGLRSPSGPEPSGPGLPSAGPTAYGGEASGLTVSFAALAGPTAVLPTLIQPTLSQPTVNADGVDWTGLGEGELVAYLTPPEPKPLRTADEIEPEFDRRLAERPNGLGQAPWILALSGVGVVLVALAYAGGLHAVKHAMPAYWIGQVVVFTPVVIRLLSRRVAGAAESFVLVIGLAVNQYALKWMYSPDQFRFPDELQHWLATTLINESGQLFRPNLALPPAVHFPGLALMGAGVSQLTGLSVFAAGILVAGVAHLCFVGSIFATVLRATGSPTIAGLTCVTYATSLHYLFFNSMYLYQTAALPFLMITVWAVRRWRAGAGWAFLAIAVVGMGLCTVSHHVTTFALVLTLFLMAAAEIVLERPRPWRALIPPVIALTLVTVWVLTVAREVIGYLGAPVDQVMQTASMLFSDRKDGGSVAVAVPLWQLAVQGLALVCLFVLFAAVARDMWARKDRDPWRWAVLVGAFVFFAGNGVRFLGSNGPEIAGRLSTFTYVPMAVITATALVQATRLFPEPEPGVSRLRAVSPMPAAAPADRAITPRVLAGATLITMQMIGARAGGWPPASQLLPGPYLAAGFERSVDAYGLAAAFWERDVLGHGNRVGGDMVSISLDSTYGRQNPVREVGSLYYDDTWTDADEQRVADLQVHYLVVDERLGTMLPTNQAYFESDPHAGRITAPMTKAELGKFDDLPGVDRLYDNGTIRIYRMDDA